MINIYFDGVLVDSDDYLEIKNDYKMFDNQFYLGATPCNSFSLKVPSTYSVPSTVTIKMGTTDFATLIVDNYAIDDDNLLTLNLVDNMVLFDKPYDASSIVPCTTGDILSNICATFGVTLGTNSFTNDDVTVNYYDNTIKARDYISYIAELNGGYAYIGADGHLYLGKFNNTPISFDIDDCEDFRLGEHKEIERVVYDNGLVKYESSNDDTLETLYLNAENVYITDQDVFDNIADEIIGLEFYNFSTGNCVVDYTATCGKLIKFVDSSNNEYVSISQYSHDYNGGWLGGYELKLDSVFQNETKIEGTEDKIRAVKVIQNRQENQLNIIAEEVNGYESEISELQVNQNSISSSVSAVSLKIDETDSDLQAYKEQVSSQFTQTTNSFDFQFNNVTDLINQVGDTESEHYDELHRYIRFVNGVIVLGEEGNQLTAELSNNKLSFKQNGTEIAYVSNNKLYITNAEILTNVIIGNFEFVPRNNGSLSFRKVN